LNIETILKNIIYLLPPRKVYQDKRGQKSRNTMVKSTVSFLLGLIMVLICPGY
jgi:hypothetical protein